jgi:trk system potassium uptake protein TrkA
MRVAFVGASSTAVMTARYLSEHKHDVVIIDQDRARIDELAETLDCSFLHGDGANPDVLRELAPDRTDVLFCVTNDDKSNLVASLVGRSLGFKRVITSIHDPQFEPICRELGLEHVIVPERTVSRYLADMARGTDVLELSTMIRDEARLFTFVVGKRDAGAVDTLELPDRARVICFYHEGKFALPEPSSRLRAGDEVVVLTYADELEALRQRWEPHQAKDKDEPES